MSTGDGYALGVDLGTSNTVAMLRWPDGRTRPLLFDGVPVMPSAVYLDPSGSLHVGRDALRMAALDGIEAAAEGIAQSLILCAHTHLARAVRLSDGRIIVNPGSVGSPGYRDKHPYPHVVEAGTPDARYAILESRDAAWQVTFRHVPYDHEAMAALARTNGQPELANALATGWVGSAKTKTAG